MDVSIQDLITTSDRASNRTMECHLGPMAEEESAQVSTHREAITHQDISIMEAETTHTTRTERWNYEPCDYDGDVKIHTIL